MGYGFPAAIGAQAAFPEQPCHRYRRRREHPDEHPGDGHRGQHNLPVKIAILNNRFLGMVRQWQQLFYDERYSHTEMDFSPDFVKLAEAYGAVGMRIEKPSDVVPAIQEAVRVKKLVVMDFVVSREENVYPMVPVGSPLDRMLLV